MVWRIHSWSPERGVGSVVSPHFGPWTFGPEENTYGTRDFEIGEEVLVELDGPKDAYVLRSVVAARQRQPAGTECPELAELNASHPGDMHITAWDDAKLTFWLGGCCEWCSGSSWRVRFDRPRVEGLDWDTDIADPLLRYASERERTENDLSVSERSRAYCVVTGHGGGRDGPRLFIVADEITVEHRGPSK